MPNFWDQQRPRSYSLNDNTSDQSEKLVKVWTPNRGHHMAIAVPIT